MQWYIQAGNNTTNHKVKVYFTLPALSTISIKTWKCHVGESNKGRCDGILGRDLLTLLGLNWKLYEHAITADDGLFQGSTTSMVVLDM